MTGRVPTFVVAALLFGCPSFRMKAVAAFEYSDSLLNPMTGAECF